MNGKEKRHSPIGDISHACLPDNLERCHCTRSASRYVYTREHDAWQGLYCTLARYQGHESCWYGSVGISDSGDDTTMVLVVENICAVTRVAPTRPRRNFHVERTLFVKIVPGAVKHFGLSTKSRNFHEIIFLAFYTGNILWRFIFLVKVSKVNIQNKISIFSS